jgi:hypothetical protein
LGLSRPLQQWRSLKRVGRQSSGVRRGNLVATGTLLQKASAGPVREEARALILDRNNMIPIFIGRF